MCCPGSSPLLNARTATIAPASTEVAITPRAPQKKASARLQPAKRLVFLRRERALKRADRPRTRARDLQIGTLVPGRAVFPRRQELALGNLRSFSMCGGLDRR